MKKFVGQSKTRKVPFMDDEVEVRMLTVGDAKAIENKRKELIAAADKSEEDVDNLELLRYVIRLTVVDADDMSDEDFESLPISELTGLSEQIMSVAGVDAGNE